jgi:TolB-like protein
VLRRALAKRPADRWPSAEAMAAALREAWQASGSTEQVPVRPLTRLMVLPFRLLRPDPEVDFLSFGLADALTVALGGLRSLVVRSSLGASRLDGAAAPDLAALAAEADVDAVLFGTLLRGGDQVRLQAQLVQAPGGTVLATATAQAGLADVFALQDELTRAVVAALELSLTPREDRRLQEAAPASGRAYELYLRGNDLRAGTTSTSQLLAARDLYRGAVDADPAFAPAWARLGRTYRVMAKYGHGDADECVRLAGDAFRRALELAPDLPLAHNLYTYFELEEPGGALPAMRRLLALLGRGTRDPQLYAGLVAACRFCGLLAESVAAHQEARRLDPAVRTSVQYTFWMQGDYARALAADDDDPPGVRLMSLVELGRADEAMVGLRDIAARYVEGSEALWVRGIAAALEGDREGALLAARHTLLAGFRDPEGIYINARPVAQVGEHELAFEMLARAAQGFWAVDTWERDRAWEPLRGDPRFGALLRQVYIAHQGARRAFTAAGGERLLGLDADGATRVLAAETPAEGA